VPPEVAPPLRAHLAARYAELHAKTNFSFLEGASHPDELVVRAAELGYAALAITDRNSLAGVVRAHIAARQVGLKLLIGADLDLTDAPGVVVWATDRTAYGRLARMITPGRRRAPKGEFRLAFDDLAEHAEGLLAGVRLSQPTPVGAESAEGPQTSHSVGKAEDRLQCFSDSSDSRSSDWAPWLARFREVFGDRLSLVAELYRGPDDERRLDELIALSRRARVPLVAAGDVHYHARSRLALQNVLTSVRLGTTVAKAGEALFPNAERYLKTALEMRERFARVPGAVARTCEIAARCTFSLDELRYEYPEELAPRGETPFAYLTRLAWAGARKRWPSGIPDKVRSLIEYELALIGDLKYEAYFLTVFDLVRFARRRGILCQGRGSAANSAVCYSLGVTAVDPNQLDVLFERFVSRQRNEAPDIDIDFEHERREEVLQYLYEKYGRERAGMTAEVITYRPRSAVRDVGKALGLSLDRVDALAKSLEEHHFCGNFEQRCRDVGIDTASLTGSRLVGLVGELVGFPRHLGQHVGGMVITQGPLCEMVPIENAAMDDRTVIEWDKDDLDEIGILKVDCLSLGMLTAIRKCFDLVRLHTGRELTLANIPEGDPSVYDMICRADTMGVFQIESRAQMSMLPRLRPRCFYDLVIEVAIVRPGPIQGNMVHPYLRRRAGEEPITYPNDEIRDVLHKTLGVPLFQEQAMRLAIVAAGFTPGEADQLRRAMSAWRRAGVIEQFRPKLVEGMLAKGLTGEFAERVFEQIRGFGEYGFPESHAASFALLVYVSCWLKHYYPAAFTAALLNSQPMGFYAPAQLVRTAREHGVEVRSVDVNHSSWDATLEPVAANQKKLSLQETLAMRLGMRAIIGLGEAHARRIEQARAEGPFRSWDDFTRRTRLGRAVLMRLASADAFGSLAIDRRSALWHSLAAEKQRIARPLLDALDVDEPTPAGLPQMAPDEQVLADYNTAGLSLRAHPMEFERPQLDRWGIVPASRLGALRNGRFVRVAGIVLVRQRPGTARGITFVTLEDETGNTNLVVRSDVWQRYYRAARTATVLVAHGRLQKAGEVIHVVVSKLEDLSDLLAGLRSQSRDFH